MISIILRMTQLISRCSELAIFSSVAFVRLSSLTKAISVSSLFGLAIRCSLRNYILAVSLYTVKRNPGRLASQLCLGRWQARSIRFTLHCKEKLAVNWTSNAANGSRGAQHYALSIYKHYVLSIHMLVTKFILPVAY